MYAVPFRPNVVVHVHDSVFATPHFVGTLLSNILMYQETIKTPEITWSYLAQRFS